MPVYESTTCFKTSSFALAGSIPTEFGELINLTYLGLGDNKLSGTPSLLILPSVVVRVYHFAERPVARGHRYAPVAHVAWCGSTSLPLAIKRAPSLLTAEGVYNVGRGG